MQTSGRLLVPALVLTAVIAAGELPPPPARQEPEATGTTPERVSNELRPTQDAAQAEKRPAVRVILPSPYSQPR
ncbi:MAG TPA: hypothetical protein VF744_21665 [Beijerinckiaceae bacterium]|jgi:hypothetical protein